MSLLLLLVDSIKFPHTEFAPVLRGPSSRHRALPVIPGMKYGDFMLPFVVDVYCRCVVSDDDSSLNNKHLALQLIPGIMILVLLDDNDADFLLPEEPHLVDRVLFCLGKIMAVCGVGLRYESEKDSNYELF